MQALQTYLPVIALVLILVILVPFAYKRRARESYFICPKCAEKFSVSVKTMLSAAQVMNYYQLKCPHCGYEAKMEARSDSEGILRQLISRFRK